MRTIHLLIQKNVVAGCLLLLSSNLFAQQYVFDATTLEAVSELKGLVTDSVKLEKYIKEIESFEREGVFFISTNQYRFIETRINSVNPHPITEEEIEIKIYADKAKKNYRPITSLIQ
jgi:hypothetical protein